MTGRFRLFLVWFAGYTLSFLILSFYCFTGLAVEDLSEVLGSALVDMTGVFAPYLTPIVAFWFAKEVVQKAAPLPQGPYKVALICSLFYNITIVLLMSALFFLQASSPGYAVNQMLELAGTISSGLAFLVGPAIGFYFGKTE
ncbi:hypothetical protein Q9L42_008795 [Methylomarinum sp. Ch1-1]|uniref:Uncharacterized protein n=1 Tax=Methylomarinum roseum TaxID=3067653 RepID=A0AAU7NYZ6_9GAMM